MTASIQDGTYAWLLCAACFFNTTILGGFILTSGVFYIMFKDSLDATDSEVAMIPAINIALTHLTCPFAGMLSERFGVRCVAMTGALLSSAGVACSAFSTKVYHLYIAFGCIGGAGLGMVMNCSVTILEPYFNKYKRIACCLAYTGFAFGLIIFPPIENFLENVYGWRGALLILAGVNIHMMVTSALFRPFTTDTPQGCHELSKEKLAHNDNDQPCIHTEKSKLIVNEHVGSPIKQNGLQYRIIKVLSLFKIITIFCINANALVYVFALMTVLTHYGSYVLTLGYSREDVVGLYMTFGISGIIARPLTGIIAQVTHANIAVYIMVTLLLNGVLTLLVPYVTQLWMLYVYAVLFEVFITPAHILGSVIIMENVPQSQVAVAVGVYMAFCVPGFLLGAPVAVWVYDYTHVYSHSFFLAGGVAIIAGLTMAPAAYHIQKQRLKKHSV